jgi:hypothetical protein
MYASIFELLIKLVQIPIIGENMYLRPVAKVHAAITITINIKLAPNLAVSKYYLWMNSLIRSAQAKYIKKRTLYR